LTLELWCL